jgi:hypothetical protein
MIGVLFTDLIDMIEAQYSPAIADAILTPAGLASRGVYTAVGVYDYGEFEQLLERLGSKVSAARPALLKQLGRFHFAKVMKMYPHLVAGLTDTFALLARVHQPIHSTVVNLHANAEMPLLIFEQQSPLVARMEYRSARRLADLAEGLLEAAIIFYQEQIQIERVDYAGDKTETGEQACFILTKKQQ